MLLLVSSSVALAASPCLPRFESGWIRLPRSAAMPMAAGFGRFANHCPERVEVASASSPAFGEVSLHETTQVDGVNRMREVAALALPAGAGVELRPGGLHLMLMRPAQPLREGERLPVSFRLRDGREVAAELEVRKAAP
ncbi:MAG: copper chaperone PCu(A)C [Pseudomonas sp.]